MTPSLEHQSAIKHLREVAGNRLPPYFLTDGELKKWLIAKNFNLEKAEKMLKKNLDWRREQDCDNLLKWRCPEVIQKYYPFGFSGYDYEGASVVILPYGGTDIRGLLHSCSLKEYIMYSCRIPELAIHDNWIKNEGTVNEPYGITLFVDMEHFSLRNLTWKPAVDLMVQLVQMYENNYPNLMKICYVVNAPKIFATAYAICKPFLRQETIDRIKIYGKTGWQEAILEKIPRDQLPVHYNGTQTDPDGDPKCSSKICYGGEVPKTFYVKKKKLKSSDNKNSYQKLYLACGSKKVFDMEIAIPETELRWEFQSEDFDVGFGISRLLAEGGEDIILPVQRVNSQLIPDEGNLVCSDLGTYQVTFENVSSTSRSKTLVYKLEIFPPSKD